MKRVYLDQNHWVALSRAAVGNPADDQDVGVLALLRAATQQGAVSCPLSMFHYLETQNRRDWRSRKDIAGTMGEISRFHAIAPHNRLIDAEIEHALSHAFGFAPQVHIVPFGRGSGFHTDAPPPDYVVPDRYAAHMPPGLKWQVEESAKTLREHVSLSGLPPEVEERLRSEIPGLDPRAPMRLAAQYAVDQEKARLERARAGRNKGDAAKRSFMRGGLFDNLEAIYRIMIREGLDPQLIAELGTDEIDNLVRSIPTLYASVEFQRNRHVSSQRPIERSDAGDQLAIPPALVYCDVLVTERQHAAGIRKLKLDEHFGTVVIHKLRDLPEHIV